MYQSKERLDFPSVSVIVIIITIIIIIIIIIIITIIIITIIIIIIIIIIIRQTHSARLLYGMNSVSCKDILHNT